MKTLIKKIEMLCVNFLLKRGYQVTFPMIYFSGKDFKAYGTGTYWTGKQPAKAEEGE
jgi:hypothetical protein